MDCAFHILTIGMPSANIVRKLDSQYICNIAEPDYT